MSGLQLQTGLISGIDFVALVDQLIALDGINRDNLEMRTAKLQAEKNALTSLLRSFTQSSFMLTRLNKLDPFLRTDVSSSNPALMTASKSGATQPLPGSYTFTPIQMAAAQQTVAKGVASDSEPLGKTGTISIGKGWSLESDIQLSDINGGEGWSKGSIRITDGSGTRVTIDLRKALTVKDVMNAINDNHDIDVVAELDGNRLVLRDYSGGDPSKFVVSEVSGGSTAASLGLLGGTATNANGVLTGSTIWKLGENMSLNLLNDGNGLVFDGVLPDIAFTCRDGSTVSVDFNRLTTEAERETGAPVNIREMTVGDLLNTINNATNNNGKIVAKISDDGKSIVFEDKTNGGGFTSVQQVSRGNDVLKALGLISGEYDAGTNALVDMFYGLTDPNGKTAKMYFQDKAGNSAVIELTHDEILTIRDEQNKARNTPGVGYAYFAAFVSGKLEAAGVGIEVRGTAGGSGVYAVDISGGTGEMLVKDHGSNLASLMGIANVQTVDAVVALQGATPGTIRFTDQTDTSKDIQISRAELDGILTASDLHNLFSAKFTETGITGIDVVLDGDKVFFKDNTGGSASPMRITDGGGSNIAARLGLTATKYNPSEAEAIANTLSSITFGDIEFTDQNGHVATITLDASDFDAVTTFNGLLVVLNDKLTAAGSGIVANISSTATGIIFRDTTHGTAAQMKIEDVSGDFISALGFEFKQTGVATLIASVTPGEVFFRDTNGDNKTVEITKDDLDAVTSLSDLVDLLNDKIDGDVGIVVSLNAMGTGIEFTDTARGTAALMWINDATTGANLMQKLGVAETQSTKSTDIADFLSTVTPGEVKITDQDGGSVVIDITQADLDGVTSIFGLADLFNDKIIEQYTLNGDSCSVRASINGSRNGLSFYDIYNHAVPAEIIDFTGGNIVSSLGLTQKAYSNSLPQILEEVMPGDITFTDQDGNSATITITQDDIDGITSLDNVATLLNDKLSSTGVGIVVGLNAHGTRLQFNDTTGGSANPIQIVGENGCNFVSRFWLEESQNWDLNAAFAGVTPGDITFTDQDGNSTTITITQGDLDSVVNIEDLRNLFNAKLDSTGVGIEVNLAGATTTSKWADALKFKDTSGGTGTMSIVDDGITNMLDYLGIDTDSDTGEITSEKLVYRDLESYQVIEYAFYSQPIVNPILASPDIEAQTYQSDTAMANCMAESAAIVTQTMTPSGVVSGAGTLQTRNLIGGMDTVLVSTLNGGYGLDKAIAGGAIEVQDRSGKTATLTFSQTELNSMQTLTDAMKIINTKLTAANVKMYVQINDSKTGLQVVDTSGASTHNLIFKDMPTTATIPGQPAIAGVDAVSGAISGYVAKSYGDGLAKLEFEKTAALNGFTFAFTDVAANEEYDATDKKFTVYVDSSMTDADVKAAIDNLIAAEWSTIYPSAALPPPEVTEYAGLADAALADAVSGDETAITSDGTLGRAEGTAVLTFENTHWMNGFAFEFTTVFAESGYDTNAQKFTFWLDKDALAGKTAAEQDALVKEAIDHQIGLVWAADGVLPSLFREVDPPKVKLEAGLAAKALVDAETGGMTAIMTNVHFVSGAVMGVTPFDGTPDTEATGSGNIASSFGLNVDAANSKVSGSSLNRQVVSYATPLADLNAGKGVTTLGARIVITDSSGRSTTISIPSSVKTVGDFINEINKITSVNVVAKINERGDGITLEEFARGAGTFSCYDADSTSKFAATLGIAGSVSQAKKDEDGHMRITASETHFIEVEAKDSLEDIRQKINDLDVGYSASILVDGSAAPYRLSISGKQTGAAGGFNVDLSAIGLTTETMSEAKDAKIIYGDINTSSGLVLSSKTNSFKGIISGIDLTITGTSDTPVTITSAKSNIDVKVSLETFVENYNKFREELNEHMTHVITNEGIKAPEGMGSLWNSSVAKAFDRDIADVLLKRIDGIPGIRSLADLGITMRSHIDDGGRNPETGKLHFDEDKFLEAWERDPEAVQKFFFDEREYLDSKGETVKANYGWAQKFSDVCDTLIGSIEQTGKVNARLDTLTETIDRNEIRIEFLTERLEFKRQMYMKQFIAMEQAMARMSNDMNAVGNISNAWQQNYSSG